MLPSGIVSYKSKHMRIKIVDNGFLIYSDMAFGFLLIFLVDYLFNDITSSRFVFIHTIGVMLGGITLLGLNLRGHYYISRNKQSVETIVRFARHETYLRLYLGIILLCILFLPGIAFGINSMELGYIAVLSLSPLLMMQWYFLGIGSSSVYSVGVLIKSTALLSLNFYSNYSIELLYALLISFQILAMAYVNYKVGCASIFCCNKSDLGFGSNFISVFKKIKKRIYLAYTQLADILSGNVPFILIGMSAYAHKLITISLLYRFSRFAIAISSPVSLGIVSKYSARSDNKMDWVDNSLLYLVGVMSVFLLLIMMVIYFDAKPLDLLADNWVLFIYSFLIVIGGGYSSFWLLSRSRFGHLAIGQIIKLIVLLVFSPVYVYQDPQKIFAILLCAEVLVLIYYFYANKIYYKR